jgi:glucose-6-phosphate 1-dehydrogenase
VLGQFRGYRDEPGVEKDSKVPTYAAVKLYVDSWRWEGVPFLVRAGKALENTYTEVTVELRQAPQVVFSEPKPGMGNYIRFRLSPTVAIGIGARAKRGGDVMVGDPIELSVMDEGAQGLSARLGDYERLLGDAMAGDATLFARQDVVEAAWAIVDPTLRSNNAVHEYDAGSAGPPEADRLVDEIGGWQKGP